MAETGLGSLQMVNPHRAAAGWSYLSVPAVAPDPLPVGPPARLDGPFVGAGRTWTLPEFHAETASTALVVVVDGVLVHAWYADGVGPRDLLLGASATKSLLAHLVGMAVRSGAVELADRVVAHVPELADTGYAQVSVGALLTMTSGVDWVEDHRDPAGPAAALLAGFDTAGDSRRVLAQLGPRHPAGERFAYCTADSQVLDWVRERATGTAFPQALAALWRALGCTDQAVVAVDGEGVALAGGGVAASARDWARIGLLQLDGTAGWGAAGRRVRLLDREWTATGSAPSRPFLTPGRLPSTLSAHVGFGYHWWPLDDAGSRVAADGSRGQFVYVDRLHRVVVVKTSRWAFADAWHDRQCRDLSYLTLPVIADRARFPVNVEELQP